MHIKNYKKLSKSIFNTYTTGKKYFNYVIKKIWADDCHGHSTYSKKKN